MQEVEKCGEEIEAGFAYIQAELQRRKYELMQTLVGIREILQAEIEKAIAETTANAHLDYKPVNPLAALVWTRSAEQSSEAIPAFTYIVKADIGNLQDFFSVSFQSPIPEIANFQLFRQSANLIPEIPNSDIPTTEELGKEASTTQNMSLWPANPFPQEETPPMTSESAKSNITRTAKRPLEPSPDDKIEKKRSKSPSESAIFSVIRPHCQTCRRPYTALDHAGQCVQKCHCKACTLALIVAGSQKACLHCSNAYSYHFLEIVKAEWEKCYCCGVECVRKEMINVMFHGCVGKKVGEMAYTCLACWGVSPSLGPNVLKCCKCEDLYRISPGNYKKIEEIQGKETIRACCPFEEGEMPHTKLSCGHLVCERHARWLQMCRICHKIAELAAE